MATNKNLPNKNQTPTFDLAAMMASMTPDQLAELTQKASSTRQAKLAETIQADIDQWEKTATEQAELAEKILTVLPEWKPKNMGDKIVEWLADQDEQTDEQIKAVFGKSAGVSLAHLVKSNRLTLANGKYSVTIAKEAADTKK